MTYVVVLLQAHVFGGGSHKRHQFFLRQNQTKLSTALQKSRSGGKAAGTLSSPSVREVEYFFSWRIFRAYSNQTKCVLFRSGILSLGRQWACRTE